jgi:hypothetical protein
MQMSDDNKQAASADLMADANEPVQQMALTQMEAPVVVAEDVVFVTLEDSAADDSEQTAVDAELNALHAKLATALKLSDRELELLGLEAPSTRKSRRDNRAQRRRNPDNGRQKPLAVKKPKA